MRRLARVAAAWCGQFMVESLLLSLGGGVAGVVVARWTLDLLLTVGAAKIPRVHEIVAGLDGVCVPPAGRA